MTTTGSTSHHPVLRTLEILMVFAAAAFTASVLLHHLAGIEGNGYPYLAGLAAILWSPLRRLVARFRQGENG